MLPTLGLGPGIVFGVLLFRVLNAWLISTYFAPDEYYQAQEPAYLYATGLWSPFLPTWGVSSESGGVGSGGALRNFRELSWEWDPRYALRPALPVLALSRLHGFLLTLERRGVLGRRAAGWLHAKAGRLAGAAASTGVDLATVLLAQHLGGRTQATG
eukprot:CAMPEP_0172598526 /NCGR_PEP_ID=MMETSP1068-20121228/18557_1 /TAXON_ID=35684 /ORGANISM="Pseudopedinella elastica, Strain CCMP716" /LENGTH=156 /DNA_ID=CAMNT_0013398417 /DNA_START=271 /DNA_END=737 /DNA_ORIENTATION=-